MSDSNRVAVLARREATWGVTPTSAGKTLRLTSESLEHQTSTTRSAEIRADRQTSEIIRTGVTGAGALGLEFSYGGVLDDMLEAAFSDDFAGDVLENGVDLKSFSIERHYQDLTNEFMSYKGMGVDTFSLTAALESPITGSVGFMGKRGVPAGATIFTGAAEAASTTQIFNSVDHIPTILEGGGSQTGVTEISFQIANNIRVQRELGELDLFGIGLGTFEVSGTLQVYYQSRTLLEKYTDFAASALSFTLQDTAGNSYVFFFPRVKYTAGTPTAGGGNQDVFLPLSWEAELDPVTGITARCTRTTASS